METKQIVLEEITSHEFDRMQKFWNKFRHKRCWEIYSKIVNPIIEQDYEKLLFSLVELPYADQLCVHEDAGKWVKEYIDRISDAQVRDLARIAANNRCKRNYLEIKLRNELKTGAPTAIIGFIEFQDRIISYEISTPLSLGCLFTVRPGQGSKRGVFYNNALWAPENYAGFDSYRDYPCSASPEIFINKPRF